MRENCIFWKASCWRLLLCVANNKKNKWLISFSFSSSSFFFFVCVHWLNHKFPFLFWGSVKPWNCLSFTWHVGEGRVFLPFQKHIPLLLRLFLERANTHGVPAAGGGRGWWRKAAAVSFPSSLLSVFFPLSEEMNHAPTTAKNFWKLGEHWCRTKKASSDVPAQIRREWLYFIIFFPFALCCH